MKYNFSLIKNYKFYFFTILCFSFILRVITIGDFESWDDEKLSVLEANGMLTYNLVANIHFTKEEIEKHNTINNVILSTIKGDGGNGIFYIVCLHYWTILFGNTDFAVRFFSLILGVFSVILMYYFSLEMFENKNISILIMFITSIHPQLITYSQEARAYALALFLTLLSSLIFLKIVKKNYFNCRYLLLYMLIGAASILSHYSTIYIFIAHFIILLFLFKIDLKNWVKFFAFACIPICIVLFWLFSFGFEGLKIIAIRNQNYSELSSIDPSNSFYMKSSLYSICAGWIQNLLVFSGNTFMNLGYRILSILPLLIIPLFLIIQGIKKTDKIELTYIKILFILSISSLIYATILSLISGHIISFQQLYSIFSTPYFIILIGLSIFKIIISESRNFRFIMNTIISLQIIIMMISTITIYLGFDSHTKSFNKYQKLSENIYNLSLDINEDFIIKYKDKVTALEINKYLHENLSQAKQVIDTAKYNPNICLFLPKSQKQIEILE